jgi:enoyl-CoA hydratase
MAYTSILVETIENVGLIRLNRPQQLNALNSVLMEELATALEAFDRDEAIRCMVITGNERAFAAGADIKEMAEASAVEMLLRDHIARWDRIQRIRKPIIAAVSGWCLGGGCELAMACDIIIASETAVFGQPEINIGVMPGAGGTQRLTRAIGKSKAMEMILTGRYMSAREAEAAGLVSRVVPVEVYLEEAIRLAKEIAARPPIAVRLAKEAVNKAFETSLRDGLEYERRLFYLLFATEDQKEGMRGVHREAQGRMERTLSSGGGTDRFPNPGSGPGGHPLEPGRPGPYRGRPRRGGAGARGHRHPPRRGPGGHGRRDLADPCLHLFHHGLSADGPAG